jgi:hypothetical protein
MLTTSGREDSGKERSSDAGGGHGGGMGDMY